MKLVFMTQSPGEQMVRDRRYSCLEFQKGAVPGDLSDLQNDPWETVNLADEPGHAKVRSEMAAPLRAGWKAALPAGAKRNDK